MGSRVQLQTILETLLGGKNVYFQPPPTVQMQYPAIVYNRTSNDTEFADNSGYMTTRRYSVQVIDADPDSVLPDKLSTLPMCISDRFFTVNNLNHWNFNLYF